MAGSHAGTAETRTEEMSTRQQEAMVSTCPGAGDGQDNSAEAPLKSGHVPVRNYAWAH